MLGFVVAIRWRNSSGGDRAHTGQPRADACQVIATQQGHQVAQQHRVGLHAADRAAGMVVDRDGQRVLQRVVEPLRRRTPLLRWRGCRVRLGVQIADTQQQRAQHRRDAADQVAHAAAAVAQLNRAQVVVGALGRLASGPRSSASASELTSAATSRGSDWAATSGMASSAATRTSAASR